jgi:hypothetical protein
LDIDLKHRILYVAALGNNSLEVVDLSNGKIVHSIQGLDEPQGVAYIPQHEEIIIANGGSGDCYFYNANSFEKIAIIHLASDADDIRYDSIERKIYVGYGNGGIAVIDADTHKQVNDVKLPAHPESFQIDKKLNRLFVNLPDAHMVGVVDLNQMKLIAHWARNSPTANFPMAIDTVHHRVFIGYRHPARLVILNAVNGTELTNIPMVGDADDLYYDNIFNEIFVSGGDGYINIFQHQINNIVIQIANILTTTGARTSLYIPKLKQFILAVRNESDKLANISIYKLDK